MNERRLPHHCRRPATSSEIPLRHLNSNVDALTESTQRPTGSSTGSSLPHSFESSLDPTRGLASPSGGVFVDSGYDSVGSPHVLSILANERDEELGTMFAMSIEDLPGQYEDDNVSTALRRYGETVSPGLPTFHSSPPPGTFRPLSPAANNAESTEQTGMSRREWRSVSTQTPPGSRGRNSRIRPRSAPLYEEREDSSDEREEEEEDDESVFMPNTALDAADLGQSRVRPPQAEGPNQGEAVPPRPPLPDVLPDRRPRSASVPALSRIYEQQVGEQLRELGDSIFREHLAGPRSLPNDDPLFHMPLRRRNSISQSFWDLWCRLVNMAQGEQGD